MKYTELKICKIYIGCCHPIHSRLTPSLWPGDTSSMQWTSRNPQGEHQELVNRISQPDAAALKRMCFLDLNAKFERGFNFRANPGKRARFYLMFNF